MTGKAREFWIKFYKLNDIVDRCDTEKLKKVCKNLLINYKGMTDAQMKEAIIDKILGTGNVASAFIMRVYVDMITKL